MITSTLLTIALKTTHRLKVPDTDNYNSFHTTCIYYTRFRPTRNTIYKYTSISRRTQNKYILRIYKHNGVVRRFSLKKLGNR